MTPEDMFSRIVKKELENELIPFLRALEEKEKKNVVTLIKQHIKEYSEFVQTKTWNGSVQYGTKGSKKQFTILGIAAFVCMNRSNFEKLNQGGQVMAREVLNPVLEWYCPYWFADYINGLIAPRKWIPVRLDYSWLMELEEKGFVHPLPELVVRLLPTFIINYTNRQPAFEPDNVLRFKQTLGEHIWYFFQYPSNVHSAVRYVQFGKEQPAAETGWITVFKKYTANGLIDRRKLLQETILATTRNFDKTLSAWFTELLLQLEPTPEELLDLQKDLFNMFNSPHGKVTATAMQCCKRIAENSRFDVQGFLDYMPLLLASDTKSLVSSVLQLLDKLVKKYADKREQIVELASGALIHKDENTQTRAARLIAKYGDAASPALQQIIAGYSDTLFVNAKSILQDHLLTPPVTAETVQESDAEPEPAVTGRTAIPEIHNADELVFLASQAFDNNEPYHIDQLPAALITLQHEIRGKNISRLEPALQRAYKMLTSDWRSNTGYLDHLLATFFINYAGWLINTYPQEAVSIASIQAAHIKEEDTLIRAWRLHDSRSTSRFGTLNNWNVYKDGTLYDTHRRLLQLTLDKLEAKDPLPLLSTPTHYPAWINACTLISRLQLYQKQGVEPDAVDMQVALSRCDLQEPAPALHDAKEQLTGQYLRVMCFLLDNQSDPVGPFTDEFLWMTAALTRSRHAVLYGEFDHFYYKKLSPELLTGQYRWSSFVEKYVENRYTYLNGKMKTGKVPATREILDIQLPKKTENTPVNFLTKLFSSRKTIQPLIYEWLTIKKTFLSPESNDMKRLLALIPNNPEPLLAQVVHHCLRHSVIQGEGDKKMVNAALEMTLEIWKEPGEMAHLFVATAMICSDKTAASYAAEIWISGVQSGSFNSSLTGSIIGKHERIELAPLKRFTDLVMNRMFQVSPLHNRELEKMLTACLKELPDQPITNLKKLLEIYLELLSVNQTVIHDRDLVSRALQWSAIPSLSKLVKSLKDKAAAVA